MSDLDNRNPQGASRQPTHPDAPFASPTSHVGSGAVRTSRRAMPPLSVRFPILAGLLPLTMFALLACGSEVATPSDTPPTPTIKAATTAVTASPQTEAVTPSPRITAATRTAPTAPALTPTPAPTNTAAPTDTPTTTPVPYNSRENPVLFGRTGGILHEDPAHRWQFVVLTTIPDAWPEIQFENRSNAPPGDDRQFYMVHIRAEYIGPEYSYLYLSAEFQAVGASNETVDSFGCGVIPDPLDIRGERLPGRPIEGNLCFDIPSEDADSLMLFVDVGGNSGKPGRVWFALRPPESAPTVGPGRTEVEEYALTVCGGIAALPDQGTWGEIADALGDFVGYLEGLTPPGPVAGYHQANLALAKAFLAFAEEKEGSAQFDPVAFDNIPNLMELNLAIHEEQQNLDRDTYNTLSLIGCFS